MPFNFARRHSYFRNSQVVHSKVKKPEETQREQADGIDEVSYQSDFEPEDES